jgi:hypothetical protein
MMEDSQPMTPAGTAVPASAPPPRIKPPITPGPEAQAAMLRSLNRLVRGLSALFWGLPAALIVCVGTATAGWFSVFKIFPALAATGLILFGLFQMDSFQKQERPWINALERAKLLAMLNVGFSPFLFFWNRMPGHFFFELMVNLMALTGLLFLFSLNHLLARLSAMLPDETLRHETTQFTALNRGLLLALLLLTVVYLFLKQTTNLPEQVVEIQQWLDRYNWFERGRLLVVMLFVLLPLSMTMALLWKTKEVILESVFSPRR